LVRATPVHRAAGIGFDGSWHLGVGHAIVAIAPCRADERPRIRMTPSHRNLLIVGAASALLPRHAQAQPSRKGRPMNPIHVEERGLSFFADAWSEARSLALAYSFEQPTRARQAPR
jgi:hypothetical protein